MELFTRLFGNLLVLVYHCFDRIVIHGYLSGLSRPEQVVHFVRQVHGIPVVSKRCSASAPTIIRPGWRPLPAIIRSRWNGRRRVFVKKIMFCPRSAVGRSRMRMECTSSSKAWNRAGHFVSACRSSRRKTPTTASWRTSAAALRITIFISGMKFWARIIVRVASFFPFHATYWLNGHSFIEQELKRRRIHFQKNDNAFLAVDDAAELQAAADRLSPHIIRKQLNYWTLILGPKFSKRERGQMNLSRFYSIAQIEYCRNFVFKRHFPIHKLFERSCEIGLWRLTANRISEIFGVRLSKRLRGKLATVINQIEHGHHVFRAYWKNAFLKQYEKFSGFLRNELCSNNLRDFGLKKGLDHLDAVRKRFQVITDRFAGCQAQWLNVHLDFPLLQR